MTNEKYSGEKSKNSLYEIKFDDLSLFKLLKNKETYKQHLCRRLYDKNIKSKQLDAIKSVCPTRKTFNNKFKINIIKPNLTKEEAKLELLKLKSTKYSFCNIKVDEFSYFKDLNDKERYKKYLSGRIYDKKDTKSKQFETIKSLCPNKKAFNKKFKIDVIKANLTKEEARLELLKLKPAKPVRKPQHLSFENINNSNFDEVSSQLDSFHKKEIFNARKKLSSKNFKKLTKLYCKDAISNHLMFSSCIASKFNLLVLNNCLEKLTCIKVGYQLFSVTLKKKI